MGLRRGSSVQEVFAQRGDDRLELRPRRHAGDERMQCEHLLGIHKCIGPMPTPATLGQDGRTL
jgi:hypothetical protein